MVTINVDGVPDLADQRYRLIEPIGHGAVATVWKAHDLMTSQIVAVKLMQVQALGLEAVQRMALEAKILIELRHPNIIGVYGTGVSTESCPYVIMEWVDGGNLRRYLTHNGPFSPRQAAQIGWQIASAIVEAHRCNVIHRDLKPENVLIATRQSTPDNIVVKVADFGMAKVLREGAPVLTHGVQIFGTPQYMSPERARGKPVDGATDVYALGLILYELLTNKRAYDGKQPMQVMLKQVNDPPPSMDALPKPLAKVALAALIKDPQKRNPAKKMQGELARLVKKL
jgi:serine/threonine protein kinase